MIFARPMRASNTCTTTDWRSLLAAGALALVAWFAGLSVISAVFEPSREMIVLVPQARVGSVLSVAPVSVLDGRSNVIRVRGESRGFVRSLYASGAWLVLPAMKGGCKGQSPWR